MNPLLIAPPRTTKRIEFKSRPDLTIETHILCLNPGEFFAMGAAMKGKEGPEAMLCVEIEHQLCDAQANLLLQPGEGVTFAKTLNLRDMAQLRKTMDSLNSLSDEAVEQTEKN